MNILNMLLEKRKEIQAEVRIAYRCAIRFGIGDLKKAFAEPFLSKLKVINSEIKHYQRSKTT